MSKSIEMKKQLNEKISLQKIAGLVNESSTNLHPEIINAMENLRLSLDTNLQRKDGLIDFDEITQFTKILFSKIKKYR